jgi:hypothetical protein
MFFPLDHDSRSTAIDASSPAAMQPAPALTVIAIT